MPTCAAVGAAKADIRYPTFEHVLFRSFWPPAVTHHLSFESHPSDSDPPLFVMAFRQQLATRSANAQQAYDAETQQMLQAWRAETSQQFIQACEAAADERQYSCKIDIVKPQNLLNRGVEREVFEQPLEELLMELGFPEGKVDAYPEKFKLSVKWSLEDATGSIPEPQHTQRRPHTVESSRATCPICQEHGLLVVLVPCGHVICRDCHRSGQLRECPFCRKTITSATDGLFMD